PLYTLIMLNLGLEVLTVLLFLTLDFTLNGEVKKAVGGGESSGSMLALFKEGLRFIKADPKLVYVVVFLMLVNFMYTAINVGLPSIQIHDLQFSNAMYAIPNALFAVGMIGMGLLLARAPEVTQPLKLISRVTIYLGAVTVAIGFLLGFGFTNTTFVVLITMYYLAVAAIITYFNVPMEVWLVKNIAPEFQGRVFNTLETLATVLNPVGFLFFGMMFDVVDGYIVLILTGISMISFAILYPRITKVDLEEREEQHVA
ncbi:MAG: hypothetical protein ACRC5C_11505, partial [Bacilli bacterium]